MRNSLLGALTVALAAGGTASASVWTISGASIGGTAQSVTSIRSGVIDISGGIQDALDDEFDAQSPGTPILSVNTLAFFAFEDTGGNEYFGFYWLSSFVSKQLTFSASAVGSSGLQTDTTFSASPSAATFSSGGAGESYYYLYSGVGPGSSISMSGLVPNLEIQWLDWDGSTWQLLGSGTQTGGSAGNQSFALGAATAVPGGAISAVVGAGLAGSLIGRRRSRASKHLIA